jgi:hypothetical protein
MIDDQIITIKKEKENARDIKLYLNEDNILVSVTLQLDEFVNTFESLFYYIIENIKYIHMSAIHEKCHDTCTTIDCVVYMHFKFFLFN